MNYKARYLLLPVLLLLFGIPVHAQQSREVMLAGYKQKPSVPTSGSGLVKVVLKGDTLQVSGDFSDLMDPYRGAYIMLGKPGDKGNSLFRLKASLDEERTGGTFASKENSFALSESHKKLLEQGNMYISIITSEHQNGEIVGSIPQIGNN